jgi:hypothetical protein
VTSKSVRPLDRDVEFSGRFEGSQLVVGDHNTIQRYEGTVVQILPEGAKPTPRATQRPQTRLPRLGEPPLGRDRELRDARGSLGQGIPAEFHGPPGIGKSALIRHLAREAGGSWPDGVVHARVAAQPLEDVLQWLFEVFWTTEPRWAPGPFGVREYLRGLRALVILDDVGLSLDEVTDLLDALGQSTFLLAGAESCLDPGAGTVALRGLAPEGAVAAFERCLGRALHESERLGVARLVQQLEGVPGLVLEAARSIRDGVCGLDDLTERPAAELDRRRVLTLTEAQRSLLALLAELAPAAVPVELLLAGGAHAADLDTLEHVGVIEANSPRYALARPLAPGLVPATDPATLLEVLTSAASGQRLTEDAAPTVVAGLEWGRRAGALDAVVETARAVDGAMIGARRTGAWGAVLACGASAALESGRESDAAYFLHQQGTRWLMLGDREPAEDHLRRALELRERIGDGPGAAATRHNLDVLHDRSGAVRPAGNGDGGRGRGVTRSLRPWGFGTLGAIVGVGLAVAVGSGGGKGAVTITRGSQVVRTVTQRAGGSGRTVTGAVRTVFERGATRTATSTLTSISTTTSTTTTTTTTTVFTSSSLQAPG